MELDLFDYDLPEKFIAQQPATRRDYSRLLILERRTGNFELDNFYNILNYLNRGDVLVLNESKVNRCRLFGIREKTGGKVECFVLEKVNGSRYLVLLRPSARLRRSNRVIIGDYFFRIVAKLDYGKAIVEFNTPIERIFEEFGKVPLPPYIKNHNIEENRYQTVYAEKSGSSAAPTAGLHFTEEILEKIKEKGVVIAKLGLHIGLDTFKPISEPNIENHRIHSEYYYIEKEEALKINKAKNNGGRIIAVGTTTVRVLETLMIKHGGITWDRGRTDVYIYPGFKFKAVDAVITNFHLPKSTLLVMISAFAGRENILKAYKAAMENNFRFYSFGDCMLIR